MNTKTHHLIKQKTMYWPKIQATALNRGRSSLIFKYSEQPKNKSSKPYRIANASPRWWFERWEPPLFCFQPDQLYSPLRQLLQTNNTFRDLVKEGKLSFRPKNGWSKIRLSRDVILLIQSLFSIPEQTKSKLIYIFF